MIYFLPHSPRNFWNLIFDINFHLFFPFSNYDSDDSLTPNDDDDEINYKPIKEKAHMIKTKSNSQQNKPILINKQIHNFDNSLITINTH